MLRSYFIACLIVGLVSVTDAASPSKNDRERDGLTGTVQRVIEESGIQIDGSFVWRQTTTYDLVGRITEVELASGTVGGQLATGKVIYERDSKGRITRSKSFGGDGVLRDKTLYVYDKSGNQIEQAIYDKDGNLKFKFVDVYDAEGNKVQSRSYVGDGSLKSKSVYTYDSKGDISSMFSLKGCITDQDCKTLDYKAVNTYDTTGHLAEAAIYKADGSVEERRVYSYNANGQVQNKAVYNFDGSIREKESYVYEYDSNGNWIKKTITQAVSKDETFVLEAPHVIMRAITYYK